MMTLCIEITMPTGAVERRTSAEEEELRIGRDPACHIVLEDLDVSRHHASLVRDGDRWLVIDRSSNGTFVGGHFLQHDARLLTMPVPLRIGPFTLVLTAGIAEGSRPNIAPAATIDREVVAIRRRIHRQLLEHIDLASLERERMDAAALRPEVTAALRTIVESLEAEIPLRLDRDRLVAELTDEALGLGPLEALLADEDVSEIMVVDPATIFCERDGRIERTGLAFTDDSAVRSAIERIVTPLGRRIDESSPYVDARLRDGSRVNAVIGPLALRGPCITIRKFRRERLTLEELIRFGSLTESMARFLRRSVAARKNIVISGGTGSGKTTLLNVLSAAIPEGERIVTIEDAAELQLTQEHVVSLEARPANMEGRGEVSIRDLVRNALRMRPDRILVGECRGAEALDMMQAMNTGHDGSMTTTHANSPAEAIGRLETLALMSGLDLPARAIRERLAASVDLIVQQSRFADGSRRITAITEVGGIRDDGRVQLDDIFRFKRLGLGPSGQVQGSFRASGYLPSYLDDLIAMGLIDDGEFL